MRSQLGEESREEDASESIILSPITGMKEKGSRREKERKCNFLITGKCNS